MRHTLPARCLAQDQPGVARFSAAALTTRHTSRPSHYLRRAETCSASPALSDRTCTPVDPLDRYGHLAPSGLEPLISMVDTFTETKPA